MLFINIKMLCIFKISNDGQDWRLDKWITIGFVCLPTLEYYYFIANYYTEEFRQKESSQIEFLHVI